MAVEGDPSQAAPSQPMDSSHAETVSDGAVSGGGSIVIVDGDRVYDQTLQEVKKEMHSLDISDGDHVYEQTFQEVQRYVDILPALRRQLTRISELMSYPHVLPHILEAAKRLLQQSIGMLSLSSDDIYKLDKETCSTLLRTIKKVVPSLHNKLSGEWAWTQPWPKAIIHLGELSHCKNSSDEVVMNDWHTHLKLEVGYIREMYSPVLRHEHMRLEWLMSKDKVADKLERLNFFLEKCMNLLAMQPSDIVRIDRKECRRLVQITELFLMGALINKYGYASEEKVWPFEDLCAISDLLQKVSSTLIFGAVSSDFQYPPGGGALSESDWHHQAYKELVLARKLYSSQLDEAYNTDYTEYLGDVLTRASHKFLEKSLEFLATSKAEMVSLSKEKCYYRMMLIKLFVLLTKGSVSVHENSLCKTASSNSTRRDQLESSPNLRDWIYEELKGIRKNYSYELDEAYRITRGLCIEGTILAKKRKVCIDICFEELLTFLGFTRADLALLSEEECFNRLKRIAVLLNRPLKFESAKQYAELLESSIDSTGSVQPDSLPYWRDEIYDEIKSKKKKFLSRLILPCKGVQALVSQTPGAARELVDLERRLSSVYRILTTNRCEIALCSEEDYEEWVVSVNGNLVKVWQILTRLQKMIGRATPFPCNAGAAMLREFGGDPVDPTRLKHKCS